VSETSLLPAAAQTASALALVAAQPGIWMADQLSPHGNAYTVAHYIEINGPLDAEHMAQAIIQGLSEADTVSMRFEERDGIALQTPCALASDFQPECVDLRQSADPEQAALALMRLDLATERRILSGKTLHRHVLIRVSDARWFWYQRYHHIQVDGFSFTAIARRIATIYTALCQQNAPEPSPFVPFSDVVEEVGKYQQGAAFARDAKFWREKAATLPAPATICPQPLGGQVPSVRLHRLSCACDAAQVESLTATALEHPLTLSDIAIALVALWVSRLSGQTDFCGGFIFMRRMGSAALCATGPVINVLPVAMNVDPAATLSELAVRLRDELKKVRRHQRYDAEQITRDLGMAGDAQPLYGTVFNFKMFDYQIDFNGVAGITHDLASGPVRDLEIALHIGEDGALTVDLQANAERYDRDELDVHLQRLPLLLRQFAANARLPVGDADLLSEAEGELLARVNSTAHPVVKSTLSQQLAQQAGRTPHAPALADQQHQFSYAQTRQQVTALAQQLIQQGVKRGDIVAVALPRSVFLSLALMAIVEAGAAYLPLDTGYPDERLRMMLEDANPRLIVTHPDQLARFAGQGRVLLVDKPLSAVSAAEIPVNAPTPEHAAYLIFTSGSTGRPKGVVVGHQAIVNRLLWMQDHYPIGSQDVVLQKTP